MPNGFTLPPLEQQQLREACVKGSTEEALHLLDPKDSALMGSVRGLVGGPPKKAAASLDYVFHDDCRNSVVHYLCGAKIPVKGVYVLFLWLDRFCYSCRSSAQRNDEDRAQLVKALIDAGYPLDFSSWNAKKQGIVHFCVTSNSIQVLRAVLEATHAEGFPQRRKPDVRLVDYDGRSPLHHALEHRNFDMIKILIAAGALDGLIQPLPELLAAGMRETPNPAPPPPQPPSREQSSGGRWASAFRKKGKVKELEKRLATSEPGNINEVQVMTEEEVWEALFQDLESLQSQCCLDPSSALTFLAQHDYRLHEALEAASQLHRNPPPLNSPKGDRCIVCYEEARASAENRTIHLPCGHVTCDSCWKRIVQERLEDGDVLRTMCPEEGCAFRLPLLQAAQLLGDDNEAHFMHLFYLRYVDANPDMSWCPGTDCGRVIRLHDSERISIATPVSVQCSCKHSYCLNCRKESHEPATCSQVEEWMSVLDVVLTEKRSMEWVKAETVKCPRCQTPIERDGGCNHMSCTVCHQQFCYQCGRKWKGHSDHYTCSLASIDSENEKAPKRRRIRTRMKGLTAKFKTKNSLRASFGWHLQQYLKHNPDEQQLRYVADYMINLLRETSPGATSEMHDEGSEEKTDGRCCEKEDDYGYIRRSLEVLLESERMLRNAYILSFKLRNGSSRKKFLTNLIEQLESAVQMLKSSFTSFPGFSEIRPREEGHGVEIPFTQNSSDFFRQLSFVHSLNIHQKEVDDICCNVLSKSDQIRRASRLNLFQHAKPHKRFVPAASSLELPSS